MRLLPDLEQWPCRKVSWHPQPGSWGWGRSGSEASPYLGSPHGQPAYRSDHSRAAGSEASDRFVDDDAE